jgi:hypothetical protein
MFDNAIALHLGDTGDSVGSVSITDTDNGTTTRRINLGAGQFFTMTVAHSESNEQKPFVSDRHLVRFDREFPDADGKPLKISVYQVIVCPRHALVTTLKISQTVHMLLSFVLGRQDVDWTDGEAVMSRILSGES